MKRIKFACSVLALSLGLLSSCASDPGRSLSSSPALQVPAGVPSYTVEGAVRVHGQFRLDEDLTIYEAVTRADPHAEQSNLAKVILTRGADGSTLRITTDLRSMYETGDTTYNINVMAGDAIYVPTK